MFKLPQNPYVIERLEQYFEDVSKVWSIEELVDEFHARQFDGEVIELLSAYTVDRFYAYFKVLGPLKFVSYAQTLLALGARTGKGGSEDYYEIVFLKVFEALKRMHDESPLMELRMNKFMEFQQVYEHKITAIQSKV
jgi:hypothetical protein